MANASFKANVAQEVARSRVAEQLMPKTKTLTEETYPDQTIGFTKEEPNADPGLFGIGDIGGAYGAGDGGGSGSGSSLSGSTPSAGSSSFSAAPMSAGAVFGSNLGFGPVGHAIASALLPGYTIANAIAGISNAQDNSPIGPTTGESVSNTLDGVAQSYAVSPVDAPAVTGTISGEAAGDTGSDLGAMGLSGDGALGGDGGGDGGGGGGKIVCTAMNKAYGFGSYRQTIWLDYSAKHLTKSHERGYHRIFRPLVKFAFNSGNGAVKRTVRKFLEWIMRLRTADLKAELRGKNPHPVRRVIRQACEYICYGVGKL